jgi:hypothetical protein
MVHQLNLTPYERLLRGGAAFPKLGALIAANESFLRGRTHLALADAWPTNKWSRQDWKPSAFAFPIQIAERFRLVAFDLKEIIAARLGDHRI